MSTMRVKDSGKQKKENYCKNEETLNKQQKKKETKEKGEIYKIIYLKVSPKGYHG